MEMIQNNTQDHQRKEMVQVIIQKFLNIIASRQQLFKKTIMQNRRKSIQRIRFRQMLLRQQYFQIMTDIQRSFIAELASPRSPRLVNGGEELVVPKPIEGEFWENVVKNYTEDDWIETFRMSKGTFDMICRWVAPGLKPGTTSVPLKNLIPLEKRVALSIYTMSTGEDYRQVARLFGVSRTSVCKFVKRFSTVFITSTKKILLKMPRREEMPSIFENFQKMCNLPLVFGCLGEIHLQVNPPPAEESKFLNANRWPSIILSSLVDDKLLFRDIGIKMNTFSRTKPFLDSTVMKETFTESVNDDGDTVSPYTVSCGNCSFPLDETNITPFPEARTREEEDFNAAIDTVLNVQEEVQERLFARWRILSKKTDLEPYTMELITLCCCLLHNLLEEKGEPFTDDWKISIDRYKVSKTNEKIGPDTAEGIYLRDFLCGVLSSSLIGF